MAILSILLISLSLTSAKLYPYQIISMESINYDHDDFNCFLTYEKYDAYSIMGGLDSNPMNVFWDCSGEYDNLDLYKWTMDTVGNDVFTLEHKHGDDHVNIHEIVGSEWIIDGSDFIDQDYENDLISNAFGIIVGNELFDDKELKFQFSNVAESEEDVYFVFTEGHGNNKYLCMGDKMHQFTRYDGKQVNGREAFFSELFHDADDHHKAKVVLDYYCGGMNQICCGSENCHPGLECEGDVNDRICK